jgi:predicted glycosyltransferase involved in capsule biosynthesis
MAFWKNDYVKVNGFEEAFEGWGYEDSEFVQRLYNNGLVRKNAKLLAPAVHLFHKEKSTERAEANRAMLNNTINSRKLRADRGVDQYLSENLNKG